MCHPTIIQRRAHGDVMACTSANCNRRFVGTAHWGSGNFNLGPCNIMFHLQFFHPRCVKYIAIHVKAGICDVLRIICVPQLFVAWAMHPNQFRTVIHNMQTCGELYVHLCGTYLFDMICIVYRTRIVYSHIYVYKLPFCPVVVVANQHWPKFLAVDCSGRCQCHREHWKPQPVVCYLCLILYETMSAVGFLSFDYHFIEDFTTLLWPLNVQETGGPV